MFESEMMQNMESAIQITMGVFSIFFAMTSAYLAGLYYFLWKAQIILKVMAFVVLSIGFMYLGGVSAVQQNIEHHLLVKWSKLASPTVPLEAFQDPVPFPGRFSFRAIGFNIGWATVLIGWSVTFCVYLMLGYMTFFNRWRTVD